MHKWPLALCRPNIWPNKHLPQLKLLLQALGQLMALVGEQVAGLCDEYMRLQVMPKTASPTWPSWLCADQVISLSREVTHAMDI